MGLNFTVAMAPTLKNIDRELQYVKAALLYADKVTLISPMAYIYTQLSSNGARMDIRSLIRLLKYIVPLCHERAPETYRRGQETINELSRIVSSKQYKSLSMPQKIEMRRLLNAISKEMDDYLLSMIGESQSKELASLLKSEKLVLKKFEHNIADTDGCVSEYFGLLMDSIHTSFPLFDEISNDLMAAAVRSRVISLSDTECRKITHAGLSKNFIHRLPSFDSASVDEILDIRKELGGPLIRFRGKMLEYSDNIQAMPWDKDFIDECSILYEKEIIPSILEIEEQTKDNGFVKNLAKNVITDGDFLKSAGGLLVGVAAAGVISSFSQAFSTDTAVILAGGTWAAQKIAMTYEEYHKTKQEITRNDLYFYYRAGQLLKK